MAARRPELSVRLVEQGERLGGDHVWSFFESDVAPADAPLLEPMIARRWPGYSVAFPGFSRNLSTSYASVTSERLDQAVRAALPEGAVLAGCAVSTVAARGALLSDGRRIAAGAVIDARGLHGMPHMAGGWQKFMGQTLRCAVPHGLDRPVVMDARVEQLDGYRFVYCLPFSETEVFVEDTYYADSPALDLPVLRRRIAEYAAQQGWQVAGVAYEETGVLPVIAGGDFSAFWSAGGEGDGPVRAGARAGLVHPLRGASTAC